MMTASTTRVRALLVLFVLTLPLMAGCKDSTKIYDILASTADVPEGSADCVAGGTRIDYGYDDGTGDGEAADGILHADEITTSQLICHDDANAPAIAQEAPAGPAGTHRIEISGGDGEVGPGGSGGSFSVSTSTGGTSVYAFRTGSLAVDVTLPVFEVDLGAVPVEITSDTTLSELPGMPSDGVYYEDASSSLVVVSGGMPATATGLHVAAGVTLTLPDAADDTVNIILEEDLHLEGMLIAGSSSGLTDVAIQADDVWAAEGSGVDMVSGAASIARLFLVAVNRLASGASIDSHVGGGAGAPGGEVTLHSSLGSMIQTGDVDVRGDDDASGAAGPGGSAVFTSGAAVSVGGDVLADGGTGSSGGGAGGLVSVNTGTVFAGSLKLSGSLLASGGDGTDAGSVPGGGGLLDLTVRGGDIAVAGQLHAMGGDADMAGGIGGGLNINSMIGSLPAGPSFSAREARFDADIQLHGGAGDSGGPGGNFSLLQDSFGAGSLAFYGVEELSVAGGAGGAPGAGGPGGGITIVLNPAQQPLGTGAIVLRTEIDARGGADGGSGGFINLHNAGSTWDWNGSISPDAPTLVVEGQVDARGGEDGGSSGGNVTCFSARDVVVDGDIRTSGGSSLDDSTGGGWGGSMVLSSYAGSMTIQGSLEAEAGDGLDGGPGGSIVVGSSQTDISGDVLAGGGDGADNGGSGGGITMGSASGLSSVAGVLDVTGGAGTSGMDGPDGSLIFDGF